MTLSASRAGAVLEPPLDPVEWRISYRPVPYPEAIAAMEARVQAIRAGTLADFTVPEF